MQKKIIFVWKHSYFLVSPLFGNWYGTHPHALYNNWLRHSARQFIYEYRCITANFTSSSKKQFRSLVAKRRTSGVLYVLSGLNEIKPSTLVLTAFVSAFSSMKSYGSWTKTWNNKFELFEYSIQWSAVSLPVCHNC